MNPSLDLTAILRSWPESPDQPGVRMIRADDGREVIQRRVPMGVIQMEVSARPDGAMPQGCASLLAAFRTRWGDRAATPTVEDLAEAEEEASLYLQRAVAWTALGDFDAAIADAVHVCELARLLGAERGRGAAAGLAVMRVQAIVLQVRAEVARALHGHGAIEAVAAIDRGLAALGASSDPSDGGVGARTGHELQGVHVLRALRATLVPKLPSSQREELRARLEAAIRSENFELAAILRDELRQLDP